MELTKNKLQHIYGVSKKMQKMVSGNPEKFGMFFTPEAAFTLGFLHDIGYAFTESPMNHEHVGGTVLRTCGFNYAKEIYYHGDPDQKYYDSPELQPLQYCDMTINPFGEEVSMEQRVSDIKKRHGEESLQATGAEKMRKRLLSLGFKDDGSGILYKNNK